MRAEIISVGTELLLGDIVNTNAQFLAQQLAALGYTVYYQTVVGDNPARLRQVVSEAKQRSDVLVFSGGLGPTEDDLTKEVVAEAFGDTLVMDPDEMVKLEQFFIKRGATMTDNNRKQAMVPRRGRKLENANGTAPGAYFRQGSKYAILLPGPPREMQPMFLEQALPLLEAMQDSAIRSLVLRVFGIGESELEYKVMDLLDGKNPTAALYAKTGEVHIRITAKAASSEQADLMCEEYALLFRRVLGHLIYSANGDDLETTAVKLLQAQGATVATAESCTGGLLGERITSVPGSSQVYGYGAITYANDAKHRMLRVSNNTLRKYGAVSSQVAGEMALGAARKAGDTYGIGITGIAGPDGGSVQKPVGLVYVALASGKNLWVKKLSMSDRGREYVRELATQHALDMLRRAANGLDIPGGKHFTKYQQADFERVGRPRRKGGAILRTLVALLVTAALLIGLVGLLRLGQRPAEAPKAEGAPSTQGYSYGSEEYTKAACELVRSARADNPAVTGFVAMPGEVIEQLVAQPPGAEQRQLDAALEKSAAAGLPVMAQNAAPAQSAANALVLGGEGFSPLLSLDDTAQVGDISTFTYYTANDAKVYQVFAVYMDDAGEVNADGFDPLAENLATYADYMRYVIGSKARSVYDLAVGPGEDDSFMTLAAADPDVDGRRFYVSGVLLPPGTPAVATAAVPVENALMPAAWYSQTGAAAPNGQQLYNYWLRWYLTRDYGNSDLQLLAGMPAQDAFPMVTPTYQALPEQPASSQPAASQPQVNPPASSQPASGQPPEGQSSGGQSPAGQSAASQSSASLPPVSASPTAAKIQNAAGGGQTRQGAQNSQNSQSNTDSSPAQSQSGGSTSGGESANSSGSAAGGAQSGDVSITNPEYSASPSESAPASSSSQPVVYVPPTPVPQRAETANLTVTLNGQVTTAPAADILAQICQAEVPAADPTVIRAVAVAAHSWILNQQGGGIVAPPVAGRQPSAVVKAAVAEVSDMILSADADTPAFTPFFQMAAQGTNPSQDLFGIYRGYLAGVSSPYEENMDGWRRYHTLTPDELAEMVKENLGLDLWEWGEVDRWISEVERNEAGYVLSLKVGDTELSGTEFWQRVLVQNGQKLLPSYAFEIDYDGEGYSVISYGSGHGCGMSLFGAASYAREGWSFDRILEHYYPGTQLLQLAQ